MRKVVISGMIGNGLEWYDYALYGHLAGIISTLFFPSDDPYVSLIATFGVFAAGFAMRPLGAVFFGYLGDRYGRKTSLACSILLMAIPTACIGLLPTYAQIGIWAPVLLTLIRLLQGLSLGGEFSGSITFMVEHAPPHRRGIIGSFSVVSLIGGMLLGSLMATIFAKALSPEDFQSWGWRVPFLLGIVIGLVGFYIRNHTHESPCFAEARDGGHLSPAPLRESFRNHWRDMLMAVGIYLTVTVPFYVLTVFINTYLSKYLGYSIADSLTINTVSMLVMMLVVPIAAYLSDRHGRTRIQVGSAGALLLAAYPLFLVTAHGDLTTALLAQCGMALIVGSYIATVPTILVEMFPTRIRYTGMAIAYNLCAALFGGTAPMVSTWLIGHTGNNLSVAWYLMLCAAITLVTLRFYKDRGREALR